MNRIDGVPLAPMQHSSSSHTAPGDGVAPAVTSGSKYANDAHHSSPSNTAPGVGTAHNSSSDTAPGGEGVGFDMQRC